MPIKPSIPNANQSSPRRRTLRSCCRDFSRPDQIAWIVLPILLLLVVWEPGLALWRIWRADPTLSHAPLLVAISLWFLWNRRAELRDWQAAHPGGLALLASSTLLYLGAHWADIELFKGLSLIGLAAGVVWFLGGNAMLRRVAAPLGLLLFTIPLPTSVVARFQFFLQISSSAYAALLSGLLGIPVHREGVALFVSPDPARPPIFSVLVAQRCSGLASLMVLLALGYLIAWQTPLPWKQRLLLLLLIPPLTLLTNALRLALILLCGAKGNVAFAMWVHDHEQPVLMLLCGAALMGVRAFLLHRQNPSQSQEAEHGSLSAVSG